MTLVAGGHLILISVRGKLPAAKCHLVLFQIGGGGGGEGGGEREARNETLMAAEKKSIKDFHRPLSRF